MTYQTVAAQLRVSTGSVSTAGTPPEAPWLLTSNGAGTAATTPKHLSLPNAGGLAYPANDGAALHDTSFTYICNHQLHQLETRSMRQYGSFSNLWYLIP